VSSPGDILVLSPVGDFSTLSSSGDFWSLSPHDDTGASVAAIRTIHDLSSAIRGRRSELGLTQAALATRAGVSRSWLIDLEGGLKTTLEVGPILKVLDALDLHLVALAPDEDVPAPAPRRGRGAIDLDAHIDRYRR
jgi:DNA-binding XRE family transcriptional regulator